VPRRHGGSYNRRCAPILRFGGLLHCFSDLRRYDAAPKIQLALFKTCVYFPVILLVRFLEKLGEYVFAGGTLSGIPEYVSTHFAWDHFAAVQIWIFVLFLIYTSVVELNSHLGNDALMEIFFTGRSSVMTPEPGSPVHQPQDDESRPTLSMSLGRVDCVE
jgi:hypothetical protein